MQKHSTFQLRSVENKALFSSFIPNFPLSQRSYDKSAVSDITDAGSYVRNLCCLTYIPCNHGHLRPKERREAPGGGSRGTLQSKNIWPVCEFVCVGNQTVRILSSAWEDIYRVHVCMCVCELEVQVLCMWVSGLCWSGGMTISEAWALWKNIQKYLFVELQVKFWSQGSSST